MKELAQLPTPTIATRTFSSGCRAPLPPTPLPSLTFEVPPRQGWGRKDTPAAQWLHARIAAADPFGGLAGELVSHVPDTLDHRDRGQPGNRVDRQVEELEVTERRALREHEADRK